MNIWIPTLACAALAVCSTLASPPTPRPMQNVFDDKALQKQFETKMVELLTNETATPQTTLKEQLSRKSCKLELPAASNTALSPAEIYQQRLDSVLMVAKLHHCSDKKCVKVHANIASGVILREDGLISSTISIPYRQLPVTIDSKTKSLGAASKDKPPSDFNGMPLVMDMNHQMTFKNAVASREVLKLLEETASGK